MSMYTDGLALGVIDRQATSMFRLQLPAVFAQMVRASMSAEPRPIRTQPSSAEPSTARPMVVRPAVPVLDAPASRPTSVSVPEVDNDRWSAILDGRWNQSWLGQLLAEHTQASDKTSVVVRGLSVERLVRLANVQHNRCRRDSLEAVAQRSRALASEQAWTQLVQGLADMQMRDNTAWSGTVNLLTPGSAAALEQISRMGIADVIGVCRQLIQAPYAEARRRGIT